MVKSEVLRAALALAEKIGHIFVATADKKGVPHVAAAGKLSSAKARQVAVEAWFCTGTVSNVHQNKHIALVVWDPANDVGYQILGKVEKIMELAVLDGYAPEVEKDSPLPQVERQLVVRVERVLSFTHAPHSDVEE